MSRNVLNRLLDNKKQLPAVKRMQKNFLVGLDVTLRVSRAKYDDVSQLSYSLRDG